MTHDSPSSAPLRNAEPMDEAKLAAFANARGNRYAVCLGAILATATAVGLAIVLDAKVEAWICSAFFAQLFLMITMAAVVFHRCPRCRKFWNIRGLFGFTPYTTDCMNCGLLAPSRQKSLPRTLLSILLILGPIALLSGTVLAAHSAFRPPIHRHDVSVRETASLEGTEDFVSFRDGVIRTDLLGSHIHQSRRFNDGPWQSFPYHAVPLVSEDWAPSDPVRVWVFCNNGPRTGDCVDPAAWIALLDELARSGRPLENGRVIPHANVRGDSGWRDCTDDAASRHGIHSAPDAIFVSWPQPRPLP